MKSDWSELTMTLLLSDFEEHVITVPYNDDYGHLKILSGYASAAYLKKIIEKYKDIHIDLIIGMAKKDGIPLKDHLLFQQLMNDYETINVYYQTSTVPTHRKIYAWCSNGIVQAGFVGSANFSFAGFERHNEQLITYNYDDLLHAFDDIDYLACTDSAINQHINFPEVLPSPLLDVVAEQGTSITAENDFSHYPKVELSLLKANGEDIHNAAGLNWGQREGRNRNQAYIPVAKSIHNQTPDFFPPKAQHFTLHTDDGSIFTCVMAQENSKALQTTDDNSLLGLYFRNRLNVPSEAFITKQDLVDYGRTTVTIYKVDSTKYVLDFSL